MNRSDVRKREAADTRTAIIRTRADLTGLREAWGVWADSVRQDSEQRNGVPAGDMGAGILTDPEYGCALDIGTDLDELQRVLDRLTKHFEEVEPPC
jgi:hypothetical protein